MPGHWERALIRAELIEREYKVVALEGLGDLLRFDVSAGADVPLGAVIVDRDAIAGVPTWLVTSARAHCRGVPFLLLTGAIGTPDGPAWDEVLRRPISVGQVAERIGAFLATKNRPAS